MLSINSASPDASHVIVDSAGPFQDFLVNRVSLNNHGQLAFTGQLDDGQWGVFVGPDPIEDRVLAVGDPLFGSIVSELFSGDINDLGQVAISYELASGVRGIAVATLVPEPSSFRLLALAFVMIPLAMRRSIGCKTRRP